MIGMYAERKPKGFGFSDTAFRIFILMASRRIESDRFFTRDYRPEVYTKEGIDWVEDNSMRTLLLRHFPELEPALRGVENPFAPWQRSARVIELAPGVYSLGHGKGGHVHAFLVDTGGELSLVDTLFENDARLVLEAIHAARPHGDGPEAHRDHARPPLAPRRPRRAQARERRDRLRPSLGGRHRRRRPARAAGQHPPAAVAEADPVPARSLAQPAQARPVPGRRAARRGRRSSARSRCCTPPATRPATSPSRGPSGASRSSATPSPPGPRSAPAGTRST